MGPCRHCRGLGYIPHKGEPNAADPCGCDEREVDEDEDPPEPEPTELDEWRDYDPEC